MDVVFDAGALIAYLRDEPGGYFVDEISKPWIIKISAPLWGLDLDVYPFPGFHPGLLPYTALRFN